jgi:hypothetical protein
MSEVTLKRNMRRAVEMNLIDLLFVPSCPNSKRKVCCVVEEVDGFPLHVQLKAGWLSHADPNGQADAMPFVFFSSPSLLLPKPRVE